MNQKYAELKLNINTYDIDIAGHVNNIVYVRWFEDLRTKLFNTYFNLQDLLLNNLYPVVISTNITYKKPLNLFDKPAGIINLKCCNHGIMTLKAEIKLEEKIAAFGEQKCVLMNLKTRKMNKEILKFLQAQNV
jgi:acyl-CoA thioester hydrolase